MNLQAEAEELRKWAEARRQEQGEWESDYTAWERIYEAVEECLAADLPSPETVSLLLYTLARDHEDEVTLDRLSAYPEAAFRMAERGIHYSDSQARWQIAVLLGRLGTVNAVGLLREMMSDDYE